MILFSISLVLCLIIIVSSGYAFTRRSAFDQVAVQSAHKGFVPRIGGLAIFISVLSFIPLLNFGFIPLNVVLDLKIDEMIWLIISTFPVFLVGIAEDLGYEMHPKRRLLASAISGFLVVIIFQVWISKLGILGIDYLLSFGLLGVIFTIFATVGVVNAFNLIDGLNGLASYVTISTAITLSIISFKIGSTQITIFLILITATSLGFLVLNFPLGKIFLGDGGAYFLGHLLVWSSIILINYEPSISSFAILLIFFWPVADTGLAIWRRWKLGNPTDRPDRLHFHQVAMRFLEIRFFGQDRRHVANPLATVILIPFISVPQIFGVLFWNQFNITFLITVCMALLFTFSYFTAIKMAKKSHVLSQ